MFWQISQLKKQPQQIFFELIFFVHWDCEYFFFLFHTRFGKYIISILPEREARSVARRRVRCASTLIVVSAG